MSPDQTILALFCSKKKQGAPEKSKDYLSAEPLKSLKKKKTQKRTIKKLGGNFGPEKKYVDTPPPNSPQTPSRPLAPPPPPLGIFNRRPTPPLPGASDSLPLPRARKIKNIRNVHHQKTFRYLWRFCSLLFRGFFVALFCLEKQCSGLLRYFFVAFSWPPFWANFTRTRPGTIF